MMMRMIAFFLFFPWVALASGYLSVYEDLPLAAGLVEVPGSALSFDSQDAEAKGPTDKILILKFYAQTLPQLGWIVDSPTQFHREQEVLRIDTTDLHKGLVQVRFRVSPQ
jgi:hypothetical protein